MLDGDIVSKYKDIRDEQILRLIRDNDTGAQDYLIEKYKNLVRVKARQYFIMGADRDDIIQEGMIGLYKAIRDYRDDKSVSFYSFAELCVNRQIITAVKAATRQKHMPLNSYVSLNRTVSGESGEKSYIDMVVEKKTTSPEELLIDRENKRYIEVHMGAMLSVLELKVLSLYLQGKSYMEIAAAVRKDEKAVDNAIQRVRRKVEKIMKKLWLKRT